MTFNYTVSDTPTDLTKVRFFTGDTVAEAAIHTDEEINMMLALNSDDVGETCVMAIESIMSRLAHEPDMTADWLKVDWRRSVEQWERLLARVKQRFSLGPTHQSQATHAWRADSRQTAEPDYAALNAALDADYCWWV